DKPDGFNINEGFGATDTAALRQAVVAENANLGIALDGDADRLIMVDHQGNEVNGDQLILIMALARKAQGSLGGGVVGTVMTNLGMQQALEANGIEFVRAAVGDRYVLELLKQKGWQLGGESSGHIICLDKTTTGDGIIAALEILRVMLETGKSLAELASEMQICPQVMINVDVPRRFDIKADPSICEAVKKSEQVMGNNGRIVLRPSGTEPLVRVMIEGTDARQVRSECEALAVVVREAVANTG
ncbi:MAG TPA: phosphoglucosamine mutase, partial [Gammaproteobacteria bacterium]|nr:phosphoglucosamine mutase [Gammaproteobacteria bacterium]